ncbi:MAG: hypothetical protein JWQ09_324 [Segetibacter sp.]|nr:hypothetical protein [Segetibacter sp.]
MKLIGIMLITIITGCTSVKTIYLGDGMDTTFTASEIAVTKEAGVAYAQLFVYKTFFHKIDSVNKTEVGKNLGIVLPFTSNIEEKWFSSMLFGVPGDSCIIDYKGKIDVKYVGRSGLASINNIVSRHKMNNTPIDNNGSMEVTGIVHHNNDSISFGFKKPQFGVYATGSVIINDTSFYLSALDKAVNNKGMIIEKPVGMLLANNNKVIAAIDTYHLPFRIYLATDQASFSKMASAAYLSLIADYERFTRYSYFGY